MEERVMSDAPMRLRRSMLFVPGANAAMCSTSFVYKPDVVMFDLEDSVALREKDAARFLVHNALRHPLYREMETVVRVNPLDTPFGHDDLEAVIWGGANAVRMPKTDSAEDVAAMDAAITRMEAECGRAAGSVRMLAAIESANGVLNARAIAFASPRLIGIALGAEDYVRDLKTRRSPEGTELLFARCAILQAARAAGVAAFDTVFSDANDEEGFIREAEHVKQLGFDGKSLINPRQIELLHAVYAPDRQEVDHAKAVIEAAGEAERRGLGVVSLNGKMIDAPIVERARHVLRMASVSGVKE